MQSFENYLDCEVKCNKKSDPSHHHMVDYNNKEISYDLNETNYYRIRKSKIVGYANDILDRGCDWNKDPGRCHQLGSTRKGITYILHKAVIKLDMQFKKQRNHILCGFGMQKKNFVFAEVKSLS